MDDQSQLRAAGAFTAVGVVLVAAALVVTHLAPAPTGVDALPPLEPKAPLPAPAHAQPGPHAASTAAPAAAVPRLLQRPTLSKTQIAFDFAGEIWTVPRDGGEATRLVTAQLRNWRPVFSPDGSQIAFVGVMDDNADVYVVPSSGGEPRRLTYHPGADTPVGWTPDGKSVLFRSTRTTARDLPKLFTVPAAGGSPEELPLPSGVSGSYSPDGQRLAYIPFGQSQPYWRKYRGGQATPIWLADLGDSHITKIPRADSNDRSPAWVGDTVYFLSDRGGDRGAPFTLYGYDTKTLAVTQLVKNPDGFDMANTSAGPGGIVYDQMGDIYLYDLAKKAAHKVPITISAELPQVRPRFERLDASSVLHATISPTGKRVLLETHGEILSAPTEKGDVRNLTRSPGVADRDPAWSPDGKWVAWLSDEGGEYALYFKAPDGNGPTRKVELATPTDPASFYYAPRWSPDSKKIALYDKHVNLWLIDMDRASATPPTPVKVDTDRFAEGTFDPSWSPDSSFLAYVKVLENHFHAVFVYSLADRKVTQVTDGRSDAQNPRFDRGGKYLWFLASTDVGPSGAGGMISMARPSTNNVYGIVLSADEPSPVTPESDEEAVDAGAGVATSSPASKGSGGGAPGGAVAEKKEKAAAKAEKDARDRTKIDFEGIEKRIVSLPIDRASYYGLETGDRGVLFLLSGPVVRSDEDYVEETDKEPIIDVLRFDLKTRKTEPFVSKIDNGIDEGGPSFTVSSDGKKVLFSRAHKWFVVDESHPKESDGALKLDGAEVWVDPRAEWKQIYHEVWRIERDFLYDPHAHGLDLAAAEKLYGRYLDGIADRDDLNDLLSAGLANLVLGHVWAQGGASPRQHHVNVGLLGADYRVVDGHYQIARVLEGESWNPTIRAPLSEPGVKVKEGDFLLAVEGDPVTAKEDVYRWFEGRANRQTVLSIGPRADGAGAHEVTVVPVASDRALRLRTWMEDSRKKVDELSGGKVGYVYLPDTQGEGLTNFDRYYFSQTGKQAVVIDERFNHGGQLADYVVEVLARKVLLGAMTREGEDQTLPQQAIFGPKVMIANQGSGSGGDALPWLFKRAGLGPLVGTRTWGGLVGIGGYPRLMDGGHITAPRWAIYGVNGQWEVENHGIAPDFEVEQDPAQTRTGHDPQLEKAVALALEALAKDPPKKLARPAYPDYGDRLPKVKAL